MLSVSNCRMSRSRPAPSEARTAIERSLKAMGAENLKTVILQGHLDMVCEKNADKVHDFTKDPIELVRKGNILMANGTTLGADNGIAVATNLAIMEDSSLVHGPLEFLFTIDEETGLTGAHTLQPGFIESRTLMKVSIDDAVQTDAIFTILMGEQVEPRRQFIEENALSVRNLDV